MGDLELASRVVRVGPTSFAAELSPDWEIWGPNGGYLASVALRAADVLPGKPLLVYPFDPASKTIRKTSRLSKLVLVRVDESEMDADTKQRAAAGVLAFSSLCTHAGCDVNAWMAKTKRLLCYCHASQYDPLAAGKVTDGPAPRSLPWLPLALAGDELMVAGALSATPGAMTT